jgi:hypothetical protein
MTVIIIFPGTAWISDGQEGQQDVRESGARFEDPELDEEIVLGLEGVKKIMQSWAIEHDLCFEILDPTLLADPSDLGLRDAPPVPGTGCGGKTILSTSRRTGIRTSPKPYGSVSSQGLQSRRPALWSLPGQAKREGELNRW